MRNGHERSSGSSRRAFLRAGAAVVAGTAPGLAGCSLLSTSPSGEKERPGRGQRRNSGSKEAPDLGAKVRAGDLPPLRKRLPTEPLVVKPLDRSGSYGGTWTTATSNSSGSWIYQYIGDGGLVRWNSEWSGVVPNVARDWKIDGDGRTYTFFLRHGLKHHDGSPFTADDVLFVYNDVLRNKQLFPVFPEWLTAGGKAAVSEKVDDYTFSLSFDEPNGLLLWWLAAPDGAIFTTLPVEYFKRFHKKYNSDADQLAQQNKYPSWAKLFTGKGGLGPNDLGWWQNTEIPTLFAWAVKQSITGTKQRLVAERNPYYWKIDPDGRQLPYLDTFTLDLVERPDVAVLRASTGQYSLLQDEFMTLDNKPALARSRSTGHYHFVDVTLSSMNNAIVMFNLNHRDQVLGEVFRNKDFRIGMSYAIDRQAIIDTVLQRQGEPWQTAPRPESEFHNKQLAKQYTEHDPKRANEHLDRAGLVARDGSGFRLLRNGKRVQFDLSVRNDSISTWVDTAQLLKENWKRVGVDVNVFSATGELVFSRVDINRYDAIMDDGYPGMAAAVLDPSWYFPANGGSQYASRWGEWYETGGRSGEEPPTPVRHQMELYDQLKATSDRGERRRLFESILQVAQERFYVIGTVLPATNYSVVQNQLKNVPQSMWGSGGTIPTPGWTMPEQYFWQG